VNAGGLPPKSMIRQAMAVSILILYSGFILVVTLSPTQLDVSVQRLLFRVVDVLHRYGVPTWFGYGEVEFLGNIAMFIPFGFMLALLFPHRFSWLSILVSFLFSAGIEFFQREFLDERIFDLRDMVANTLGGTIGFIVAFLLRSLVYSRDQRVIARALWQAKRGLPPTG